jgi:hypothetical protein
MLIITHHKTNYKGTYQSCIRKGPRDKEGREGGRWALVVLWALKSREGGHLSVARGGDWGNVLGLGHDDVVGS